MNIQFNHKGETITGKVLWGDAEKNEIIVFPDRNLGELGWSHLFQKKENKWTSESFLKEKYPATYLDIVSQLSSF